MTTTPNLALPLIAAAQAQKHVTHNEALLLLDALVGCAVKDKDLAAPPSSPAEGDRYIVAASATGAWSGKTGAVAAWQDGLWRFYGPKPGWIAFVVDEMQLYHYNGSAWAPGASAVTSLQNLASMGIGTTADGANPFSTKLNSALFTAKTVAEGGTGHVQVKLSKEAAGKTASTLFQNNFSGRAECGLVGDDNFHIKTSANGSSWVDALVLAANTGAASFAAGASFGGALATAPPGASAAGLNLPHGTAPSAPANGDVWSTTAGLFARLNGVTQQFAPLNAPVFTGAFKAPTRGAFHASRPADQTGLSAAAYNKVVFNSESFDADSWYDPATGRFQPAEPGMYLLYCGVYAAANGNAPTAAIVRNGSLVAQGNNQGAGAGTSGFVSVASAIVALNGTSDYVEGYAALPAGVTSVIGSFSNNYFGGFKIGS